MKEFIGNLVANTKFFNMYDYVFYRVWLYTKN